VFSFADANAPGELPHFSVSTVKELIAGIAGRAERDGRVAKVRELKAFLSEAS
jgi:hypothetical protein